MSEHTRQLKLKVREADSKRRTVPATLSTDTPIDLGNGPEILEHTKRAVDLSRAPLPLIEGHDSSQTNIGVVENLTISNGKLRGLVRFGKSERAREIFQDVLDKVVRSLSIGYAVTKRLANDDGTTTATQWTPFEVSVVAAPADVGAGFFRSAEMPKSESQKERDRAQEVLKIIETGRAHNAEELASRVVAEGGSFENFREQMLKGYVDTIKPMDTVVSENRSFLGLSESDKQRYSISKIIMAHHDPKKYWKDAGFELECSRAVESNLKRPAQGFFVPYDFQKRVLTAGTATAGAELVATDLLASEFIDVLRARSFALQFGTVMEGLVGDAAIPRKTAGVTVGWIATEGGNVSLSDPQFDQVTLTPRTIGVATEFTRNLLLQSTPAIDGIVQNDLATAMASGIDDAAINGSGALGQPTGLVNTTGVLTSTIAAAGSPTWVEVVEFETDVAGSDALVEGGRYAYVGNTGVTGNLKTTEKVVNTGLFLLQDGRLNGYEYLSTNRIATNGLIFGDWQQLVIGMWGTLDLNVDTATNSLSGTVRVVALQSIDIGVRHPEAFSINA